MELLGGLLVVLVMAWFGLTVCAGGLCSDKKSMKEAEGDKKMRILPLTVGLATGMLMSAPAFAQFGVGIEHPALFPFNVAGAPPAGVTERTTTRASVASAAGAVGGLWHHPLYPFVVAGEQGGVTRVAKRAQAAAVGSEPAVWHLALVPFSIGGR